MADIKVNHSGGIDGSDALMGPKIKDNDLQKAAQQFEAIFLRNMLKEMRKTNGSSTPKITRLTATRCA